MYFSTINKYKCPNCSNFNYIDIGDINDLTVPDIDGVQCYYCLCCFDSFGEPLERGYGLSIEKGKQNIV